MKEIAHSDEHPQKGEIDYLKTIFYKLHFAEREADMKAYLEGGGDPANYKVLPDEDEEVFKAEMGVIKENAPNCSLSRKRKAGKPEEKARHHRED